MEEERGYREPNGMDDKTGRGRAGTGSDCYGGGVILGLGVVQQSEEVGCGRQGAGVVVYWSGPAASEPRTPAFHAT